MGAFGLACVAVAVAATIVFTLITEVAVAVHPNTSVPVTVYVVFDDGFAETAGPVVGVNPVVGLQV